MWNITFWIQNVTRSLPASTKNTNLVKLL